MMSFFSQLSSLLRLSCREFRSLKWIEPKRKRFLILVSVINEGSFFFFFYTWDAVAVPSFDFELLKHPKCTQNCLGGGSGSARSLFLLFFGRGGCRVQSSGSVSVVGVRCAWGWSLSDWGGLLPLLEPSMWTRYTKMHTFLQSKCLFTFARVGARGLFLLPSSRI